MASESTNDRENDAEDESQLPDPWETGLRRRRLGRETNGENTNNETARRHENERNENDITHHHSNTGQAGANLNSNIVHSYNASGSCGGGGGPVGALSITGATGLGAASSTPHKTPTKDSMLVPITPSTETISGKTAESTIMTSPQSHRSRRPQSVRRQYEILENQVYILLGTFSIGFILFLAFTLPLFALLMLALMAASLAGLGPVALSAMQTRYQLELEHPLGLLRYLPDSVRVLLTETTLHEYMSDTSFMMENRYLLLYFIPGIQPDELMNYINQLPRRHRDALLRPGLGRLMPSLMNRLVRDDNSETFDVSTLPLQSTGGGNMSTSSLLTLDHDDEEEDADQEVTLIEAITELRQTVMGRFRGTELPVVYENHADDNSAGEQGGDTTDLIIARPREVVVERALPANIESDQTTEETNIQAEYDVEERILSDATSAAVTNYSTQAAAMASETAAGVADTVSSLIFRFGTFTGLFAGSGGIALATYLHPSSITLGLFRRPEVHGSETVIEQRTNSSDHRNGMVYGLLATSAFGFVSAGISYIIRNRVRETIAQNRKVREALEEDHSSPENKK